MHVAMHVCFFISDHEVWLCEDPPELLGLHVLWVTRDGFQYLLKRQNDRGDHISNVHIK